MAFDDGSLCNVQHSLTRYLVVSCTVQAFGHASVMYYSKRHIHGHGLLSCFARAAFLAYNHRKVTDDHSGSFYSESAFDVGGSCVYTHCLVCF